MTPMVQVEGEEVPMSDRISLRVTPFTRQNLTHNDTIGDDPRTTEQESDVQTAN